MLKSDSGGLFLCLFLKLVVIYLFFSGKHWPASKEYAIPSKEKQCERQNKTGTKLPPQAEILV